MATIENKVNIQQYIDKVIDEKIKKVLDSYINIKIENTIDNLLNDDKLNFELNKDTLKIANPQPMDGNQIWQIVKPSTYEEDVTDADEFTKGWVEKANAYKYVIDEMKRSLTDEQIEKIAMPPVFNGKEYIFNKFINNLSWADLHQLFKDNKYLNLDIDSNFIDEIKLENYGTTPTDIYYTLLKQMIKEMINNIYNLKYKDNSILTTLIIKELYKDFNSRVLEFINDIIEKYHIQIFDELFGEHFYINNKKAKNEIKELYTNKSKEKYELG